MRSASVRLLRAIVVLDPHTGRLLTMSGGYDYRVSEFNRAIQAQRQPVLLSSHLSIWPRLIRDMPRPNSGCASCGFDQGR